MSSDSDSIESVQAKPPLQPSPNPFTSSYFQDLQDPYQYMISNQITEFLSNQTQISTIAQSLGHPET